MSPILGIFASQGRVASNSYESIATQIIGAGGSSSVTFSSIPSTYTHLQIRALFQASTGGEQLMLRLNGDSSSANYTLHQVGGDGASTYATGYATGTMTGARTAVRSQTITTSYFGAGYIDILDYANTNKYKTVRSFGGGDANGSGEVLLRSDLWLNTSAINSITCVVSNGGTMSQYTHIALYGIK